MEEISKWLVNGSKLNSHYFHIIGDHQPNTTWMSQEVSKWLVNGLFHPLIHGFLLGVIPHLSTNH